MIASLIPLLIATPINPCPVPDSSSTGLLIGIALVATGLVARFLKK